MRWPWVRQFGVNCSFCQTASLSGSAGPRLKPGGPLHLQCLGTGANTTSSRTLSPKRQSAGYVPKTPRSFGQRNIPRLSLPKNRRISPSWRKLGLLQRCGGKPTRRSVAPDLGPGSSTRANCQGPRFRNEDRGPEDANRLNEAQPKRPASKIRRTVREMGQWTIDPGARHPRRAIETLPREGVKPNCPGARSLGAIRVSRRLPLFPLGLSYDGHRSTANIDPGSWHFWSG